MNLQERSDNRSLALHRAIVKRLRENPELWDRPLQNIDRWTESDGSLAMSHKVWRDILETTPREDIIKVLLSKSQRSQQLRSSSPFTGIISQESRRKIFDKYNRIYHRGKIMDAQKFSIAELEKMFLDDEAHTIQVLPDDAIAEHFTGHIRREVSDTDAYAMKKYMLIISKQLLAQLRGGECSADELETMIHDYEVFKKDYKSGHGFSDIQNDLAGKLPNRIMWITKQLIRLLKEQELREAVREYLKRPSTDGATIRQEQRRKLAELVKD